MLRPPALEDAPEIQSLCEAREIAAGTFLIPHPYPEGAAAEWISGLTGTDSVTFAIERKEDGALVGVMGLRLERDHDRAELGYWVGVPYWGHGYAPEAGRAVLGHAFETLGVNRVYALHFTRNRASGRVAAKIGMTHEATLRGNSLKWGEHLDDELWAIVRSEWPGKCSE